MAIAYTEKGAGLHAAIAAAGHWLTNLNGEWIASDDAAVQSIIDSYTLSQARAHRCAEVSLYSGVVRDRIMSGKSAAEMASWPLKVEQAAAFTSSGDASKAPMLAAEAQARGLTLADLVTKVHANAAAFGGLEALIAGIDGKHRDAIGALTTFADVAAYDITAGWPAV